MNLKWLYLGLYFGYPKCCVMAFVRSVGFHAENMFKLYPNEESLNLDYIRCHGCIKSGKMTLYPGRRLEYLAIAQGLHDEDLTKIRRKMEDVEW